MSSIHARHEPGASLDIEATVQALIKDISGLVTPPEVYLKVSALLEARYATAESIADALGQDPNLTARLLRLVNSAYFNFSERVDTVSRAVTIIGVRELHHMVLAVSAISSFSGIGADVVNMDKFWRHGLLTGLLARLLAKKSSVLHPERLFVAGLLHDIGSLLMYHNYPADCVDIQASANGDESQVYALEVARFGFSHAELGGELMKKWLLPGSLCQSIACHHEPLRADDVLDASIVCLAESVANSSETGSFSESSPVRTDPEPGILDVVNLDDGVLDADALIAEIQPLFGVMVAAFLVP